MVYREEPLGKDDESVINNILSMASPSLVYLHCFPHMETPLIQMVQGRFIEILSS